MSHDKAILPLIFLVKNNVSLREAEFVASTLNSHYLRYAIDDYYHRWCTHYGRLTTSEIFSAICYELPVDERFSSRLLFTQRPLKAAVSLHLLNSR